MAEILMRWVHPERGVLAPVDFLEIAEQFNLLDRLTEHLVGIVSKQRATMQKVCPSVQISINLAPLQMANTALIDRIFESFGDDLSGLNFELTETAPYDEGGLLSVNLARLRRGGAMVSLDDFGTGYASLVNLRRFGFGEVKIDAEFACTKDEMQSVAMVNAIVAMAAALGARTVAEGVETPEQVETMRSLGVDLLQDFHFAYPMDFDSFCQWVGDGKVALAASAKA